MTSISETTSHMLPTPVSATSFQPTTLCCSYLEEIALKRAQLDASVEGVTMSCLEHLVHFVFNVLLFPIYPAYEHFYYQKQIEAFQTAGKSLPPYESSCVRESVWFLHRYFASPMSIGSLFPSSSSLVETLTEKIPARADAEREDLPAQRYLEIGAGAGCCTVNIVDKLRPVDQLDVVELDHDLCQVLQRRFGHLPNVRIYSMSITDYDPGFQYDAVVSGVALGYCPLAVTQAIHNKYVSLTKSTGYFSYYAYRSLALLDRYLCHCGSVDKESATYQRDLLDQRYGKETSHVLWNFPPARVSHCSPVENPPTPSDS